MNPSIVDESWSVPERAGFIASIASIGGSLRPSRLPRSVRDQAVASGLVGAMNNSVVTTGQTVLRLAADAIASVDGNSRGRVTDYRPQFAGIGIGLSAWVSAGRLHRSEVVGELGRRLARSCAIGMAATVAGELGGRLHGRIPDVLLPSRRPVAALVGGGIAALAARHELFPASTGSPGERLDSRDAARAAALGVLLSTALIGISGAERAVACRIGAFVSRALPPGPVAREAAGAAGRGLVLVAISALVHGYVHRAALASQRGSSTLDERDQQPPRGHDVSGGPRSAVPYDTLGQEGARFVQRTATVAEIAATAGDCVRAPVRVYVGWRTVTDDAGHAAAMVEQRVGLAMRELEGLGAFDRAFLCVAVPAGTGFVNPVAVGAFEYLTRGDCATVALQYSLRRSFYSTARVPLAAELHRRLLQAIAARVETLPEPRRPAVVLYGESLGAWAAQATFASAGPQALDELGLRSALFPGTPARSGWARQWRARPGEVDPHDTIAEVGDYEEWCRLSERRRARTRIVLLSHDDDPVTVFERAMLIRPARARRMLTKPAAATGRSRPAFRPLTTFVLTAVDMKNAMGGDGNSFTARGHDYRGDLVRFVAAAYQLPHDAALLDRIEAALRRQLDPAPRPPSSAR